MRPTKALATTGTELAKLVSHTHAVTRVAFHPSGEEAVFGSFDTTARLWRLPKE